MMRRHPQNFEPILLTKGLLTKKEMEGGDKKKTGKGLKKSKQTKKDEAPAEEPIAEPAEEPIAEPDDKGKQEAQVSAETSEDPSKKDRKRAKRRAQMEALSQGVHVEEEKPEPAPQIWWGYFSNGRSIGVQAIDNVEAMVKLRPYESDPRVGGEGVKLVKVYRKNR